MFGSSDDSEYLSRGSVRSPSHSYNASARHEEVVIMMMSMTIDGVIEAKAIPVFAAIVVTLLKFMLRKRSRIVTSFDMLLKTMNVFPTKFEAVAQLYH